MNIRHHLLGATAALVLAGFAAGTAAAAPVSGAGSDPKAATEDATGTGTGRGQPALTPSNDAIAFAQFLPSANNSISGRTTGATAEVGEPSHGDQLHPADNSIWYTWTAPASGHVIFRTIGSNFDTVMAAYSATTATPDVQHLTKLAENDDLVLDNSTTASQIRFAVTGGQRYLIAVDGFGTATGDVKLTWTTNDDFEAAQVLSGPAEGSFATFGVHNEGTKPQLGEPRHAGLVTGTSVWYRWTAPFSGNATFETTQNQYDTVLAVYTGDRIDQLTAVAANNDLQPGVRRSRVLFAARAGQTYRIALAGLNGSSGFDVVNYKLIRRQVIAGDARVTEGNSGTRTIAMPVTLTTADPASVRVHFATANGTAAAGTDYLASSGDLTFAPGQTTRMVAVAVKGDTTKEASETFTLRLSTPTGDYTFKDAIGTGTITNDD